MEKNGEKKLNSKKNRSNTTIKIASYSVLILIAVTFIGTPIITIFSGQQGANNYGSYAGKNIYYDADNYFGRSAQSQVDFLQQRFGNQGLNDSIIQLAVRNAYTQTVEMYALLDIANKDDYYVSEKKINKTISEFPDLQTDGTFDIELYKSIPANTRKKIVEVQQQAELSSTIRDDLRSAEIVSSKEQEFLTRINNNKRTVEFIVFNQSDVQNKNILKKYAEENKDLFSQYDFKSLTVSDEEEARTIKQRIEDNDSTFEEEVASYSIDDGKEQEGERGLLYAYKIEEDESTEALQAIQDLPNDTTISDIIRTNSGDFAFYIRNGEEQKLDTNNTEQLEAVQNYLNTYDPIYLEEKIIEEAKAFISETKSSSFTEAANNNDYDIQNTTAFPLNIDDVALYDSIEAPAEETEESLQLLNKEDAILQDIFALKEGETSTYYTLDNKTYIFHIESIIANDGESVPEEKDVNRITAFMRNYKTEQIQDFVIDEKKWVDNFDTVVSQN